MNKRNSPTQSSNESNVSSSLIKAVSLNRKRLFKRNAKYQTDTFISIVYMITEHLKVCENAINWIDDGHELDEQYLSVTLKTFGILKHAVIEYRTHVLFHQYKQYVLDETMTSLLDNVGHFLEILPRYCFQDIQKESIEIFSKAMSDIREMFEKSNDDFEEMDEEQQIFHLSGNMMKMKIDVSSAIDDLMKIRTDYMKYKIIILELLAQLNNIVWEDYIEILCGVDLWKEYKQGRNRMKIMHNKPQIQFLSEDELKGVLMKNVDE